MLHQALVTFSQFKVLPDDINLDNFHYTGDRVLIVDLETVSRKPLSDEYLDLGIKSTVDTLAKFYRG
ncbi:hypothetical protein B0H66DRAFT_555649 [Apodospora peruviana]|uniref:Uncharacterized protein n=1 Tax=Apodospora peruviana TaxID=516989 RepID=A0AAE0ID80_9PEZI|nr:hypothetical protein B0H66DRAFT_555649 [Apodospora peruviana]